jgi:HD-GYP domain-containing protein (c-di-GMP phosphodiesterase class II)
MLKKIPTSELRLGMHLHALEGSWISHPFWRSRFVISDPADLKALWSCGVNECWIDIALGLDVRGPGDERPAPRREPAAAATVADQPLPSSTPTPAPREPSRSLGAEMAEAQAIVRRSREAVVTMLAEARMGKGVDAERCLPLVDDIRRSVERNAGALVSLARLKTKDDYSFMHSVAVCALMVALSRQLGHDDEACRTAGIAGLVHDIGKALMPLEVLNKPGKLSADEYATMKLHPERGHAMLLEVPGAFAEPVLDVVLHHHERMDGTGYLHRLPGERTSLLARMGAVCDVYDAITSNRPYKAGWDPAESIARMAGWAGHFDKPVFAAFVQSLGIYPVGSVVRLASQRLAVVVEPKPQALTSPVVSVFYSLKSEMKIAPQRLDLGAPGCADRIVAREGDRASQFGRLEELWVDPALLKR